MNGKLKAALITAAMVALVLAAGIGAGLYLALTGGGEPTDADAESIYVRVKPGMTGDEIAAMLERKSVIDSAFKFRLLTKLRGEAGNFRVGAYKFHARTPLAEVVDTLVNGRTSTLWFTIPEGYSVDEIAKRLVADGIIADEAAFRHAAINAAPFDYMESVPHTIYRAEGFLFPDTYEVEDGVTAEQLIELMTANFNRRLTPELRQRAADLGLSMHELVTFASLVEKEVRFAEDRPIVAQVFHKRLDISMPLQSDTTIQYLLDAPKEDLTYADTKLESPYNTYQHYGLPPGPIANPGMAAIRAVLYPAETDYLYFVADRQGHNHYSHSYGEHLRLVDEVR